MPRIIGVDPGKTTGTCLYDDTIFVEGLEFTDPFELTRYVITERPVHLIVEDFILIKKASDAEDPLRVIHFLEYVAKSFELEMHLQSPSILQVMKKRISKPGSSPHIWSAVCHVEYFLKKRGMK